MSYLDELLSGYREGLVGEPPQPIQAVRAALTAADDPRQRGALLGLLARALAAHASNRASTSETPCRP